MASVIIVDTCIFLNVLNVPGFNQHFEAVYDELERLQIQNDISMLLPAAAIVETGNHISHLPDGNQRRRFAGLFVEAVQAALDGIAPWQATELWTSHAISQWLAEFPDHAMRQLSFGDISILKDWEAACVRHPRFRVKIWSLDGGLTGYDRGPT